MASVFRKDDMHVDKPKRNVYSKTHAKSLTTKFGQIICPFCQPVMNGESFTLKYSHVFNMLPFVFPVQTRVRASFQLYYVRWRNLWNQWEDFQFKMKPNLVKPYIKFTQESKRDLLRVGGILDNIGVPVVTYHNIPNGIGLDMPPIKVRDKVYNPYTALYEDYNGLLQVVQSGTDEVWFPYDSVEVLDTPSMTTTETLLQYAPYRYPIKVPNGYVSVETDGVAYLLCAVKARTLATTTTSNRRKQEKTRTENRASGSTQRSVGAVDGTREIATTVEKGTMSQGIEYYIVRVPSSMILNFNSNSAILDSILGVYYPSGHSVTAGNVVVKVNPADYPDHGIHLSDVALSYLPYANTVNDNEKTLRIDVGPLRAIESIYNAIIRHPENNPFLVNGVPEYNKFLLSYEGGADTYNYPLRYANWQDDAFTTALHSPQQGDAPLVGLVNQAPVDSYITFANDDGSKTRVRFSTTADQQNPGSARGVRIISTYDYQVNENVPDSPSLGYVGQLEEGMLDLNKFGFTINDLRNVNSYQRWKENNLRRGYKYRDQVIAHYGVKPRFDVLDMPEYLGGSSRDMNVNQVTQTVENDNGALGDYAGQGYINGSSNHAITHFCDEEGFIIGLLTIMPIANYSQTIPKFLLRKNALDYFSPEFSKIGMQPILNREIDPIGSYYDNTGDKVFGYQRPWYDYLDIPDTLHGKFRTEFRNFVISRTFNATPTLAEDFLVYDPDQVNNIFYVDDDEDKILGQFLFDFKVRIPIPLYGIPALE